MIEHIKYSEPLYEESPIIDVNELINIFSFKKDLMVLNSSMRMEGYGRYSFICFDAFASFVSKGGVLLDIDVNHPATGNPN
jgi:hypothetical protein